MFALRPVRFATAIFFSATVFFPVLSDAQVLKDRQKCINTMNKSGQKVAKTQGKENSKCIKNAGKQKLDGTTAEDCLTADAKNKVSKAESKTVDLQAKKCVSPLPDFGFTDSSVVNAAAKGEELSLVVDVFGPSLNTTILTDKDGASCQATLAKSYEKLGATILKEFNKCKKLGLKDGVITDVTGLEACLGPDPKNKISKAEGKVLTGVQKKCVGVDLATAFPGDCAGLGGDDTQFSGCVSDAVMCRMCLAANDMDAMTAACDALDDGLLNGTCRQCGNSVTEAPEDCDDGGESATCDADCTNVTCGDGTVNGARARFATTATRSIPTSVRRRVSMPCAATVSSARTRVARRGPAAGRRNATTPAPTAT